ncbi:hypothetical protein P700755_001813 [Psychroflexus torquis ATCC 700755]|uniref:Uncharacterized protein n=1 Tax=Psychroflexus torquis (strain ATCC 700755 / CIP 106069 / ACAM 623) TaxID=313595 RepID=K4IDI8_PSYTT|nr:hypothetical protein [Psychroflexus torquis]AFU68647.1 hypothetical protein P700755_001813 [Psychroflexus torquis ATCC 700755]
MKKLVFLLIVSLSLISCEDLWNNDDDGLYYPFPEEPITLFEINIGSSGDRVAETSLGNFEDNRSAVFQIRGQHSRVSELDQNPDTGEIIFRYQPRRGFVGEDYVEIIAPTDKSGNQIFESKTLEFYIKVHD